jgi:hypothetical protein
MLTFEADSTSLTSGSRSNKRFNIKAFLQTWAHPILTAIFICVAGAAFGMSVYMMSQGAGKSDDAYDTIKYWIPEIVSSTDHKQNVFVKSAFLFIQNVNTLFSGTVVIDPVPWGPGESSTSLSKYTESSSSPDDEIIFKRQLGDGVVDVSTEVHERRERAYIPGVDPALDVRGLILGQITSVERKQVASAADIATINPGDVVGLTPAGTIKTAYGSRLATDVTELSTSRYVSTTMLGTGPYLLQLYMNDTDFLIARRDFINTTTGEITVSSVEFAVDGRAHISSVPPSFSACSMQVNNETSETGASLPAGNNTAFIVYTDPITGHPVSILCDFTLITAVQCSALQYIDNSTVRASIQDVWCHPVPDYDEGLGHYKVQTLVAIAYTNSPAVGLAKVLIRGGYLNDRRVRPTHPTTIVGINSGTTSGVWTQGAACGSLTNFTYTYDANRRIAKLHQMDEAHFAFVFGGDENGSEVNLAVQSIDFDTNGVIAQESCARNIQSEAGAVFRWKSAIAEAIDTELGPFRYLSLTVNGRKAVNWQLAYTSEEVPLPDDDGNDDGYYSWTSPSTVAIGTTVVVTLTAAQNVSYIPFYNEDLTYDYEGADYLESSIANLGQTGMAYFIKSNGITPGHTYSVVTKFDASAGIGDLANVVIVGQPRVVANDLFDVASPASRSIYGTPRLATSLDYLGVVTPVTLSSYKNSEVTGDGLRVVVYNSLAFASYLSFRDFSRPQRPYGVVIAAPLANGTVVVQSSGWTNPCLLRATAGISYGALPVCAFGFTGPVYACPDTPIPSISSVYGLYVTDAWAEGCVQLGVVQSTDGSIQLTPSEWTSLDVVV